MRASIRSIRKPQKCSAGPIQPSSPCAWCVATIGQRAYEIAATHTAGVIGSCAWMTSNCSWSRMRFTRPMLRGERTMFGSDPFAGTTTDRPTGMIPSGNGP